MVKGWGEFMGGARFKFQWGQKKGKREKRVLIKKNMFKVYGNLANIYGFT